MIGVLAAVLVWPLVHLALVARVGIDPWELFGWAMYSKPAARVQLAVDVERAGRLVPLRAIGKLRRRVADYARARTALGRFAQPDDLLRAIFESDPSIEAVELVLRDVSLDLDSALLVARDERLRFERPPFSAAMGPAALRSAAARGLVARPHANGH